MDPLGNCQYLARAREMLRPRAQMALKIFAYFNTTRKTKYKKGGIQFSLPGTQTALEILNIFESQRIIIFCNVSCDKCGKFILILITAN